MHSNASPTPPQPRKPWSAPTVRFASAANAQSAATLNGADGNGSFPFLFS